MDETSDNRPGAAELSGSSIFCSFCGKNQNSVRSIVAGPTPKVAICNECVDLARELMDEQLGYASE